MDIEAFILCDSAIESGGKLSLLGTFDTIFTKKAPFVHNSCSVVIRLRYERAEEGDHTFKLTIIDNDGKPIVKAIEGNLNLKSPNQPSSSVNLILNYQGIKFSSFGEYRIDLVIDHEYKASRPLQILSRQSSS